MSYYQERNFRPYQRYDQQQYSSKGCKQSQEEEERRYGMSNSKYNESGLKASPSFQRSPDRYYENEFKGGQPIWEHLYKNGLNSKKLLNQKHQHSKNKIDIQCTFQPIIKTNKRYLANSNSTFLERVHIWQEHKIEKMIKQKEEEVDKDLKECTFVPKINKKLKRLQENIGIKQEKRLDKSQNDIRNIDRNINPYYSPVKKPSSRINTQKQLKTPIKTPTKRNTSYVDLSDAKLVIRNELKRIAL